MTRLRFRCPLIASALLLVAACDKQASSGSPAVGAAATDSGHAPPSTTLVDSSWSSSAGPVLLLQGETRDEALVIPPFEGDSGAIAQLSVLGGKNADVVMFGRGGEHLTAQLEATARTTDAQCRLWPLRAVRGSANGDGWAIGFISGDVSAMALDSVQRLGSRDSMALAAEASRLASNVTTPTAPSFQGLRFTAHDIRRFEASPGIQAIVAHLIRRVNQEASPLEEQTLLIAERDSGVTSGPYQLAYAERAHGMEEEVPTPEVVGGVRIRRRPTLIVARDSDLGVTYSMLERTAARSWRIRWTSGSQRCE